MRYKGVSVVKDGGEPGFRKRYNRGTIKKVCIRWRCGNVEGTGTKKGGVSSRKVRRDAKKGHRDGGTYQVEGSRQKKKSRVTGKRHMKNGGPQGKVHRGVKSITMRVPKFRKRYKYGSIK